ncbi:unnamed protein product [Caenorhabditis sp. 36 PRJEB53466]|nr:unnamed protein product [Caenorhabditis sp. 36 PRJEB53466]
MFSTILRGHIMTHFFVCIAFTIIFVLFYFINVNDLHIQQFATFEDSVFKDQLNSTFPITFYHTANVDYRFSPPRLRLFSLNACIQDTSFVLVDVFYEGIVAPTRLKLFGSSLEGNCPSTYGPAKPCFYVAHTFFGDILATGGIQKVVVIMGSRRIELSVKEIDKRLESGLTMCLQPVYYYSQWQNIVLYVEAWRAQGASRFIVFYHSATKETRRVLEYYQNLGLIELRSWPSFGSLPAEIAGKYPKIDDSTFIFSYFLAMNICILDIKTTIGTIADFDEVMVPRNGTLLEYALKEMTGTKYGALRFGNNYVAMEPSIYSSDFSGVANPVFIDRGGPPKNVFNASVIDIAQVHWIKSFIEPKDTKNADGALLHLRYDVGNSKRASDRPWRFFPNNTEMHIQNMQDTANKIFNGSIPTFSSDLINGLTSCVNSNKKRNTCRSTGGMCKAKMDELYEWVYDKTEGIFLS